jgi:hypothetical protein
MTPHDNVWLCRTHSTVFIGGSAHGSATAVHGQFSSCSAPGAPAFRDMFALGTNKERGQAREVGPVHGPITTGIAGAFGQAINFRS